MGNELRVGVLGFGAIGSVVARHIADGKVAGASFQGIAVRHLHEELHYPQFGIDEAVKCCDLIIECAGQEALREHAVKILGAGVDLLASSLGALADRGFAEQVRQAGPGRLLLTSGAIGGLDLLGAGAAMGGFQQVTLTTRKLPATLIQPWMSEAQCSQLAAVVEPVVVFSGSAAQAAQKFPKSLNIAAAVALTVGDWDVVSVRLIADPNATLTEHRIDARGVGGEYSFSIKNYPSQQNPRSSGIVPWALLYSLQQAIGNNRS
ncbi:aspartate dehydrogenase domain-containing protein [Glutamicibacter sp.]|uniref:aspartate dehydrogenase domain-containing protein n=1 Tax=Glutamicibacter sp. TaxID=1931995 RepID=UPI0028BEA130|nr:aspartate dehydrogenase domain-containing protein [Glutamicibacter sp.]